ncbi:M20 metallopeptidase family protein [Candidatus Formimonas warabiya]|uniref:Amidohydrolase n=1 Tax=Formimonas warabiya TaxID=1761012 RepID=A0A3G1KX74_FORW1|nr:amidohydrolase [Candidatus Formimonas warabiya]ATW27041.1 hypothetical protein DCMF_21795 [Candidatus Formimonas warabiya]
MSTIMSDRVWANRYEQELVFLRRHFHKYPELSNEEGKTAEFISKYLVDCGLEIHESLAGHGVIGILKGLEGPSIGFRFDMDALPIEEETDRDFKSVYRNKMHACGHDGHMAVGLIAAKILSQMRSRLNGNILFIFQPAEENLPEGGAKRLVQDGKTLLSGLTGIFGFHFWPALKTGEIAVVPGALMAAGDVFEVEFTGKGAHGATPQHSSDVLMMASNAVIALTSVVLRNIEPGVPATLSVTVLEGGKTANVLPANALIRGTTRYLCRDFRNLFPEKIKAVLEGICKAYNGSHVLNYTYGYPLLENDFRMTQIIKACAGEMESGIDVITEVKPSLASEDFSVYLKTTPGCYYWVGCSREEGNWENCLHSPKFDLDESALKIATEMILTICKRFI